MKTQLVIYPAMMVMLLSSCDQKGTSNEDSIEAQNEISAQLHESDTTLVKRDGTLMDGALDQLDSIPLPPDVLDVIKQDATLSTAEIVSTITSKEGNRMYYEVTFSLASDETTTIVFDEKGKIKPKE